MSLRVLAVLLVFAASPAAANPWSVVDLGRLYKLQHCMQAARATFRSMLGEMRINRMWESNWVAYANGLKGRHDGLISCTYGNNGGTRATLVIHTHPNARRDRLLVRRLVTVFDRHAEAVTEAWKDSYR